MPRRVLLGLATALIVVRALAPGEDVGLLRPGANPLALAVPLLWLCGLVAWAARRAWSGPTDWYGGAVEAGLLVVVLFSFVATAAVASYQHPAWIVSWEWAGLLAAFFLVRQLARTASDQRGLLAVLLATGVSLAVQSVYQHALPDRGRAPFPGLTADELPRRRCEVLAALGNAPQNAFPASLSLPALALATSDSDPTLFERIAVRNNVRPETGEPLLPLALRPRPAEPPTATFTSAANLAGCLALLLPALVGCALAAWLGGAPRWQVGVAVGCAVVTALALWLTGVRSAILPCLLVGAVASVLAWRHYSSRPGGAAGPSPRLLLLLALAGPAVLLLLAFVLGPREGPGLGGLTREWSAAWAMIRDHFWLGVGPGNYSRHYPHYMAPTAPAVAEQPDNFALEVWATFGLVPVLALVAALVAFFRRTLSLASASSPETGEGEPGTRWEFYEGGLVGLLLGFVVRALPLSSEAIPAEAMAAGVRSVVWFATFALIHGIRWTGATRVLACAAGVAVLLLHLAASGGFSVPGVAQPLWLLAALALNGLPEQPLSVGRGIIGRVLPLALAGAAALLCVFQVFEPVTSGSATDRLALVVGQHLLDKPPESKAERGKRLAYVVTQLQKAAREDPADARVKVDAANWFGDLYETFPASPKYLQEALAYAEDAERIDPLGEGGYLAEARLHGMAARRAPTAELRKRAAGEATGPLLKIVGQRPNDARLHYRLALALFAAGDAPLGRAHAASALKLDEQAPPGERRLTDPQREQVRRLALPPLERRPLP